MQKYTFIDFPQRAVIIDNYCNILQYEELEKNFPDLGYMVCATKSAFDKTFLYNKEVWVPFIQSHINRKYLESICDLFEDHFLKWRPKLFEKIKSGNYTMSNRQSEAQKISYSGNFPDILYDFKYAIGNTAYSSVKRTSVHVDFQNKIFQTMIYLPDNNDQGFGGDLHLTQVRTDDSLTNIVKCEYKKNRCVILPHHPSGWHFVTKRKSEYRRKGVGVVFTVREDLQEIDSKFFEQKI